uniref:Protein kinase domain-containing protein n=1 Tax=Scylla olivacea TaxID=85551 RepID=A0A0P4W4D1_SCYOL
MTNNISKRIWIGGPPAGPGRVAWARRVAAERERVLVRVRRQLLDKGPRKDVQVVPQPVELEDTSMQTSHPKKTNKSAQTSSRKNEALTQTEPVVVNTEHEESDEMILTGVSQGEDSWEKDWEDREAPPPISDAVKKDELKESKAMFPTGVSEGEDFWQDDCDDWEEACPTTGDKKHEESQAASGQRWHDDWNVWEDPHLTTDHQPAEEGLLGEVIRRGLTNLPWLEAEPGAVSLLELGRGSYGVVHLVDYGGELLVRKRFYEANLMDDEAYALWLLEGAGGVPILRGVVKEPPTLYMTYCGCVTLEAFFESRPEAGLLLEVLLDLAQRVAEIHDKGLVHLDLKGDNVMVEVDRTQKRKRWAKCKVTLVDFAMLGDYGEHPLGVQRVMFLPHNDPALMRKERVCSEVTDVFSMGYLLHRTLPLLASHRQSVAECSQRAMGAFELRPSFAEIEKVLKDAQKSR